MPVAVVESGAVFEPAPQVVPSRIGDEFPGIPPIHLERDDLGLCDDPDIAARQLHNALVRSRRDERRIDHAIGRLLYEMDSKRLFEALGCARIEEYAETRLGLTRKVAAEMRALGARLAVLPVIDAAMKAGDVGWTKAREICRVAVPETEAAWLDAAEQLTSRRLEQAVRSSRRGDHPPAEADLGPGPARERLAFEADSADAEVIRKAIAMYLAASSIRRGEIDDAAVLAAATTATTPGTPVVQTVLGRRATCERSRLPVDEARCDHEEIDLRPGPHQGHAHHEIPPATRRIVEERDGWRCVVPGCRCTLWVACHHLVHQARGGGNEAHNPT